MWIGWLEFDVLLGDVRSLKQKRSVTRPLVAELQRKFSVSAAETGSHDLYRRAGIGVAVVSGDRSHAVDVLDKATIVVPHIRSSSCCPCAGACTALTTKWTGSQLCLPLPVASLALTT
ncbi:hypothetical protein J113_14660 [Mycobacterium tuberculosis CAS/NITR204]|uniref:Uncharacterized protein n=1 Tax=Mycobacterium tuberculosis CAS/NITR204 TaxID=1310114 RepID=R4MJD0_MYCTX|nr:hypothetical protein J113_14660 [Mycobacterium tuberculosis CAS/NITR204]